MRHSQWDPRRAELVRRCWHGDRLLVYPRQSDSQRVAGDLDYRAPIGPEYYPDCQNEADSVAQGAHGTQKKGGGLPLALPTHDPTIRTTIIRRRQTKGVQQ